MVQVYDDLDRLVGTVSDAATGGIGATTQFSYDAVGNLREVVDPKSLSTTYSYDALGRLLQVASPDSGTTTYTYDDAGNRLSQTDARGITTTYTYDALNRLATVVYPTAAENVAYTYDVASPVCEAGETFTVGRLTRITDPSGSTDYCYDRFGNTVRKVQTTAGQAFTVRYAYTLGRKLTATTYPDGTVVDNVRDSQERIAEVGVALGGGSRQVLLDSATYYPAGPSAGWTFGNGRVMARTYDKDYRASTIRDAGAGGLDIGLRYDNAGYLTELTNAALATTPRMRYGYDALGRLTGRSDSASAPIETYTYDATGNRTSLALGMAAAQAYSYAADSHRLTAVGGVARGYDAAGNLTSVGGTAREYGYNDAGRMSLTKEAGVLRATYKYNGRGDQVLRATTVSTIFVYDEAGHLLGQYGITGTPIQQYVWMDGQPVGVISGSALHYVEADHLGTPRVIVDATRQVAIWTHDLATEPFGNTAPNVDPDGDGTAFVYDLRFPGQRYDAASGLYYNYYRDYDPSVGRYTQTDPIGQMGGLAIYGYTGNSPLLYTDPTGEIIPLLFLAVGSIWTVVEIGLSIYDVYDTYKTVTNPCISNARKGVAVGLLVAGLFLPGGGYSKVDDVADLATKAWKSKIQGTAQKKGTPGHQFRTYREAIAEAKKTDVVSVHLDHGYNRGLTLDPKTIQPNRRPDVLSVYGDGRVARIEVQSKTDIPSVLRGRNSALDAQIRAAGYTPLPPRVVLPTRSPGGP